MIIDKIYIKSFGNLTDFEFIPSGGMNVIQGENESGKSTLAAFIKFMFYGFSSKKSKDSPLVSADRYINWDTHSACGIMELTLNDGTPYRIEREVYRSGKKNMGSVSIINLKSGEKLTSSPENVFLGGICEDVFNRTVFISQSSGSSMDSDTVYTSVENMLSGADEEVNTKKALSRLDSARISLLYKNEKGGKIYTLRKTIDAMMEKKLAVSRQSMQINDLKAEISSATSALTDTKKAMEKHESTIEALEYALRLESINSTIASKKSIEELESEEKQYVKKFSKNGFFPKKEYLIRLDDCISSYYSTLEEMKDLNNKKDLLKKAYDDDCQRNSERNIPVEPILKAVSSEDKKRIKLKQLSGYSLIALGIFALMFIISLIALPFLRLLAGVLTVVSLMFLIAFKLLIRSLENTILGLLSGVGVNSIEELKRLRKSEEKTSEYRNSLAKQIGETEGLIRKNDEKLKKIIENYTYLSEKYGVVCKCISDCEAFRNEVRRIIEGLDRITASIARKKEEYRLNAEDFTEEEYNTLVAMELPNIPKGTARSLLIDAKSKKRELEANADKLNTSLTQKKMRLSSLIAGFEDEDSIKKKISLLNSQLEKLLLVHEAITIAAESLEKASSASRDRISPMLSSLSSKIITDATMGKYDKINVDNRLKLSYTHNESTRDIAYLSEGTKDIVYIAFRISLISMLFGDTPPIIIDEGLSGMDDHRLEATLKAIINHCAEKKAQIFIFSPTTRESKAALSLGADAFTLPTRA